MRDSLIFTDFDGVWTDNTVWTGPREEMVRCSKYDSMGLARLRSVYKGLNNECHWIVISSEMNCSVKARCDKLDLELVQTPGDKSEIVQRLIDKYRLTSQDIETFYIGNDINDLSSMMLCEHVLCPRDSAPEVLDVADKVLTSNGEGLYKGIRDVVL